MTAPLIRQRLDELEASFTAAAIRTSLPRLDRLRNGELGLAPVVRLSQHSVGA